MDICIKEISGQKIQDALNLSWDVFCKYEAPEYTEEGIKAFHKSLNDPNYINMLKVYAAYYDDKIVGTLATRSNGNHIALFFVNGKYHKNGIGRKLFEKACNDNLSGEITVNSSPYAIEVYHHLGFKDTNNEQVVDGLRFTPMIWKVNYSHL